MSLYSQDFAPVFIDFWSLRVYTVIWAQLEVGAKLAVSGAYPISGSSVAAILTAPGHVDFLARETN